MAQSPDTDQPRGANPPQIPDQPCSITPSKDPTPVDRETILRLIEITWADIHHSRNQDWQFWIALAGVAAGIGGVASGDLVKTLMPYLLGVGFVISLVAAMVSWSHWELHSKKMAYIEQLERSLAGAIANPIRGLLPYVDLYHTQTVTLRDRFVVSGIIFSLYCGLAAGFVAGLLAMVMNLSRFPTCCAVVLTVISLVFGAWAYHRIDPVMTIKRRKYREQCHTVTGCTCGGKVPLPK